MICQAGNEWNNTVQSAVSLSCLHHHTGTDQSYKDTQTSGSTIKYFIFQSQIDIYNIDIKHNRYNNTIDRYQSGYLDATQHHKILDIYLNMKS